MIGPSKPEHVREIYSSLPADRLTVLTTWPGQHPGSYLALTVDSEMNDSRWLETGIYRNLGRRVYWADLPLNIRRHVARRITE